MAFIGKIAQESRNKKPSITVTISEGRIGLLMRGGVIAPGTPLDVQVGTDEDFGFLRVAKVAADQGTPCKAYGKTGKSTSWSATRAIAKSLPAMRRREATIVEVEEDGSLIVDLGLPEGTLPIDWKAKEAAAPAPQAATPEAAALGL